MILHSSSCSHKVNRKPANIGWISGRSFSKLSSEPVTTSSSWSFWGLYAGALRKKANYLNEKIRKAMNQFHYDTKSLYKTYLIQSENKWVCRLKLRRYNIYCLLFG